MNTITLSSEKLFDSCTGVHWCYWMGQGTIEAKIKLEIQILCIIITEFVYFPVETPNLSHCTFPNSKSQKECHYNPFSDHNNLVKNLNLRKSFYQNAALANIKKQIFISKSIRDKRNPSYALCHLFIGWQPLEEAPGWLHFTVALWTLLDWCHRKQRSSELNWKSHNVTTPSCWHAFSKNKHIIMLH